MPDEFAVSSRSGAPSWALPVFVLSLSLWIGGVVFYSGAVLPLLFMNLEPADAGRIAALVFPVYFRAGLAAGLVATAAALVLSRGGGRAWRAVFAALVVMTVAQGWSALVVHPEMAKIRGDQQQVERFQQLHHLSVRLNGIVLGGGLLILAASGLLFQRRDGGS